MTQREVELVITGMHCAGCMRTVESTIRAAGGSGVTVDLVTNRANCSLPDSVQTEDLAAALAQAGFPATIPPAVRTSNADVSDGLRNQVVWSSVFTLPLLLHMFIDAPLLHDPWLHALLSLPVFVMGLRHFGGSAWRALRAGRSNMDVLVTLGASAAYGYSVYGLTTPTPEHYLFFETTAAIFTAVFIGNYVEARAVRHTSSALSELSRLIPQRARRVLPDGGLEDIDARLLAPGDVVRVVRGESIPADGVILSGSADVDERMITGESLPVGRGREQPVIGGTILIAGSIEVKITSSGERSLLARMIELVRDAQGSAPQIQRLGDVVSGVFVPIVIAISLATFIISLALGVAEADALIRAIAVLVVACPCAMGLATPTAVAVGIGKAARHGILVRGGATLEALAKVRHVGFDKTGTLTVGNLAVARLAINQNWGEANVKEILRTLVGHSSHPISRSLLAHLGSGPTVALSAVSEEAGVGMRGMLGDGREVALVSAAHAHSWGIPESKASALLVLDHRELIAECFLNDTLHGEAHEVMDRLRKLDLSLSILSGDREDRVRAVATNLAISDARGALSPEEKLTAISERAASGGVAFVGDGINDAPALARATVGVAVGSASAVAIDGAAVVLVGGSLKQLPMAILIARGTLRTIKQNLFWAFFYNVLCIPLAALGFLSPMVAALSMAFSDIVVIGNSLRFRARRVV